MSLTRCGAHNLQPPKDHVSHDAPSHRHSHGFLIVISRLRGGLPLVSARLIIIARISFPSPLLIGTVPVNDRFRLLLIGAALPISCISHSLVYPANSLLIGTVPVNDRFRLLLIGAALPISCTSHSLVYRSSKLLAHRNGSSERQISFAVNWSSFATFLHIPFTGLSFKQTPCSSERFQ